MNAVYTYDVVIAGAGPVGLFLACELALAKCSVLVLEKATDARSPLKQLPFGMRGLSAPTIGALHHRGLLQDLELHKIVKNPHKVAAPSHGPEQQVGHFAGIPFLEGQVDTSRWKYRLPSSTPTHLLSEMAELESLLTRRAESLGVEIKRGVGVTGCQQSLDGVTIQAGEQYFAGQWLVGCDGSRSMVRKAGCFEFAGTEPEFTGYSAQVDIADPAALQPGRVLTATGMYFQSQPGYLVMVEFDGGAAHGIEAASREHVQETLRRVSNTDVTLGALHAVATWTDRSRQATTYRNGRFLIAGDAAHIHSPLGGQGLNLGLGDAMNLGWKLAATLQGQAPDGLLDSYHAERHPVGAQVLDWSRAQVAIMKPDPAARALNAIVRDLLDTRAGSTYVAGRVWGVSTHYDLGGDHPLVGRFVPNFALEDGTTIGELMHDGRAMLLDFKDDAVLEAWARDHGDRLAYTSGRVRERFNLSAALIRPDGIVAWASETAPDVGKLQAAAARWLMKSAH